MPSPGLGCTQGAAGGGPRSLRPPQKVPEEAVDGVGLVLGQPVAGIGDEVQAGGGCHAVAQAGREAGVQEGVAGAPKQQHRAGRALAGHRGVPAGCGGVMG